MSSDRQAGPRAGRDEATELEILGYRDTIFGQKVTIANLQWRLSESERRLAESDQLLDEMRRRLRVANRQRRTLHRSATWRIGSLVMAFLWPVRKVVRILFPPGAEKTDRR